MPKWYGNICPNCRWSEESRVDVRICPECGSNTVLACETGFDETEVDCEEFYRKSVIEEFLKAL